MNYSVQNSFCKTFHKRELTNFTLFENIRRKIHAAVPCFSVPASTPLAQLFYFLLTPLNFRINALRKTFDGRIELRVIEYVDLVGAGTEQVNFLLCVVSFRFRHCLKKTKRKMLDYTVPYSNTDVAWCKNERQSDTRKSFVEARKITHTVNEGSTGSRRTAGVLTERVAPSRHILDRWVCQPI